MAKELPYFRFTVQDWQNGKISLESYQLQGLFISICGYYWINDCNINIQMLEKKYKNEVNLIKELIDLNIIKLEKRNNRVLIEFLNIQYDLLSEKRKTNSINGSKGGKAKANAKQTLERNPSYKDNNKDKDKDKDKDNNIPEFLEFKNYAFNHKPNVCESDLKFKYDSWVINGWKNGNDKKIKNWKSSLLNTLPFIKEGSNSNIEKPLKMVY